MHACNEHVRPVPNQPPREGHHRPGTATVDESLLGGE